MPIKLSKGSAAANIYKIEDNETVISHLLLDWSYDSIDFKYKKNNWITINKENINSLKPDEYQDFKELSDFCFNSMNNFSEEADKTLTELNDIINCKKF